MPVQIQPQSDDEPFKPDSQHPAFAKTIRSKPANGKSKKPVKNNGVVIDLGNNGDKIDNEFEKF